MTQYVRYGLQNGNIKNIEEVESGLNCNCVYASCGGVLIARKGEKKVHHFAHYNSEDCATGYQTSIHLMAKDIINERKSVRLPNGDLLNVDKVELEKKLCNVIPDILVWYKGVPLMIEIYVTHKVDEEKLNKIKELGISCIEIDLHFLKNDIDKHILSNLIFNKERCYWLFNRIEYLKADNYKNFISTIIAHKCCLKIKFTEYQTTWCNFCKKFITRDFCENCIANSSSIINGISFTFGKDNKFYYEPKVEESNYCLINTPSLKDKFKEHLDELDTDLSIDQKEAKRLYVKSINKRLLRRG